MKCLYATLYFSSAVIPGALRAAGMCHLGGCALSLRQAESGLSSRQPAGQGVSHRDPLRQRDGCELLGAGATFLKSCKRFRFCSSAHAVWTRRGTANGLRTAAISLQRGEAAGRKNVAPRRQNSLPRLRTDRRSCFFTQESERHGSRKIFVV